MKQIQFLKSGVFFFAFMMSCFVSCIDGYKDEIIWTSNVKNVTLESPAADKITVKFSADGTEQTIEWPLVPGAGGYQVSVYNYDDPDHPVAIGEENQIVDGISVKRSSTEDTRYKVTIKALGNPKNNNKEAESATEKIYDNMLAVTAIIPNGTNLTDYFTANPVPSSDTELCYELVAGGNYSMTGNVSIGLTSVTIRGDKVSHPLVNVTDGSFVNDGAGFKLKFIDLEYSGFTGTASNAVLLMNPTFNPVAEANLSSGGYVVIASTAPVALESCKITNLPYYLFYDGGKKYAIGTFLIKDCIIGLNTNSFGNATLRFAAGMVKDMTWTNSTFYNELAPSHSSNRIMQISSGNTSSVKPANETWVNGTLTITNCTFYQMAKEAQSFNSNGAFGIAGDKVTIQRCIIVDSGEPLATDPTKLGSENGFIRRFRRGNTTATFSGGYNSYWYDGIFALREVNNDLNTGRDDSGIYFDTDPQLTYLGNGKFTMSGAAQIAAGTGDPRWLPSN